MAFFHLDAPILGGPDNLLSGWTKATGGHRRLADAVVCEFRGDLLFAQKDLREPGQLVVRATHRTVHDTWKCGRPPLQQRRYPAASIAAPKTPALSPSVGLSSAASKVGLKMCAAIFFRVASV